MITVQIIEQLQQTRNETLKYFALPDQDGAQVSLATLTQRGATVLVFYREHW